MQVCPALIILPYMMRSTAVGKLASVAMITGDLPPNSKVTGVRLLAAARITCLPTAVEPVKSKWSNGKAEKADATSTPPVTMVSSSA